MKADARLHALSSPTFQSIFIHALVFSAFTSLVIVASSLKSTQKDVIIFSTQKAKRPISPMNPVGPVSPVSPVSNFQKNSPPSAGVPAQPQLKGLMKLAKIGTPRISLASQQSAHSMSLPQTPQHPKFNAQWGHDRIQNNQLAQKVLNEASSTSGFSWTRLEVSGSSGSEAEGEAPPDWGAVVAVLSKYQGKFRECYEQALFVNSKLQGRADLFLKLSDQSSVQALQVGFEGGQTDGQSSQGLRHCLHGVLRGVQFPSSAAGYSVKFGLLFKI